MNSTTWPDGVIARYLTVAGSSLADPNLAVDVTDDSHGTGRITAHCRSCQWVAYRRPNGYIDDTDEQHAAHVALTLPVVRGIAQAHAETCRAFPRPAN